ncbi:MAG: ATP-binding protein [Thermodesulfovibrionales bacterium]|jgi:PAS domain S-box-containing protein
MNSTDEPLHPRNKQDQRDPLTSLSQEGIFREVFQSMGEGVLVADNNGRIISLNPEAERLLGWKGEEISGREICLILLPRNPAPDASSLPCPLLDPIKTGKKSTGDEVFIRKDGSRFPVSYTSSPLWTEDSAVAAVVLFRDDTQRKRMEGYFLWARNLESIASLAGGIAHDFNNLLTGIMGNVSLAKGFLSPEDKVYDLLSRVEEASMKARDLTYQLLTFAKGSKPSRKTAFIGELIRKSASFSLSGSNIRCQFTIPDDLWPVEVDENQLMQVIHNIVMNARDAMPEGGVITIQAENIIVTEKDGLPLTPGKYLRISQRDQGMGIPEENLKRIFDPYFTTKRPATRKGVGLGLSTSYSLIRSHEGHIEAESQEGKGTVFHIYLPASQKEHIEEKGRDKEVSNEKGHILLMDDEEIVREVMSEMLRSMGYSVGLAKEGREAVEIFRTAHEAGAPFDLVILDLTIPGGMGAREVIGKLKEIEPEVKAIVSSGYPHDPVMADFRSYGFKAVVIKPYKMKELKDVVSEVIGGFR